MLAFLIYLMGIVDSIALFFDISMALISMALVFLTVVISVVVMNGHFYDREAASGLIKSIKTIFTRKVVATIAFIFLGATFIPDSKTIAAMYLVPKLVENEQVQEIPEKALKILNGKLDQYLKEFEPKEK